MINASQQNYLDFDALSQLKTRAKQDAKSALSEVASEFETIFVKMMMKSMRSASFGDELFDSESAKFYRDMYDDQLALELSKNGGIGLADVLVKQLERYVPEQTPALSEDKSAGGSAAVTETANTPSEEMIFSSPKEFVHKLWPFAEDAAKELGTSPKVIIAQAALETGWGKHVIRNSDGSSSNNFFNIKADHRWDGKYSTIDSVEYIGNIPRRETANFRSYQSAEESFKDYISFLKSNSRYDKAIDVEKREFRYIEEIHAAGYATDPNYVEKIDRIMNDKPLTEAMRTLPKAIQYGGLG